MVFGSINSYSALYESVPQIEEVQFFSNSKGELFLTAEVLMATQCPFSLLHELNESKRKSGSSVIIKVVIKTNELISESCRTDTMQKSSKDIGPLNVNPSRVDKILLLDRMGWRDVTDKFVSVVKKDDNTVHEPLLLLPGNSKDLFRR